MSDNHLDDLLRDSLIDDARRDKQLADARRACEALARQDNAYESLRNCARDLLDRELDRPSTLDEYLALFAQRVVGLRAVLTPDARARLQSLDGLAGAERLALDVLLSGDADSVLSQLRKIGQSPSLLNTVMDWLRFNLENILDGAEGDDQILDDDAENGSVDTDDNRAEADSDKPVSTSHPDGALEGNRIWLDGRQYRLTDGLRDLLGYLLTHDGTSEDEVTRYCGFAGHKHLHTRLSVLRKALKKEMKGAPRLLQIKTETACVHCKWIPRG